MRWYPAKVGGLELGLHSEHCRKENKKQGTNYALRDSAAFSKGGLYGRETWLLKVPEGERAGGWP